ncbi:uncharacterized protein LOC129591406 [Paramacrobiotus metropolitanus]|uniref:uncharacterized protein LOC129591406 n=1 Tax=Paramacrobiotus metropolitanus TaxID=2943436 RepID=UPI0024465273|nr:uncharacterized protein LOC129591406 [Paramacrobiotus metropolitanus]
MTGAPAAVGPTLEVKDPYKIGPFKFNPQWVQKPYSDSYFKWLIVISCAVWYNLILTLPRAVFHEIHEGNQLYFFLFVDYLCDLLYLVDMGIKTITGYFENGILIKEPRKLMAAYKKSSTFIWDIISILPTDLFYFLTGWYAPYPILRINRIFRLGRTHDFYYRAQTRLDSPNTFRLIYLILTMIVVVHLNACVYYWVSSQVGIGSDRWAYPGRAGWRYAEHGGGHGGGHGAAHGGHEGNATEDLSLDHNELAHDLGFAHGVENGTDSGHLNGSLSHAFPLELDHLDAETDIDFPGSLNSSTTAHVSVTIRGGSELGHVDLSVTGFAGGPTKMNVERSTARVASAGLTSTDRPTTGQSARTTIIAASSYDETKLTGKYGHAYTCQNNNEQTAFVVGQRPCGTGIDLTPQVTENPLKALERRMQEEFDQSTTILPQTTAPTTGTTNGNVQHETNHNPKSDTSHQTANGESHADGKTTDTESASRTQEHTGSPAENHESVSGAGGHAAQGQSASGNAGGVDENPPNAHGTSHGTAGTPQSPQSRSDDSQNQHSEGQASETHGSFADTGNSSGDHGNTHTEDTTGHGESSAHAQPGAHDNGSGPTEGSGHGESGTHGRADHAAGDHAEASGHGQSDTHGGGGHGDSANNAHSEGSGHGETTGHETGGHGASAHGEGSGHASDSHGATGGHGEADHGTGAEHGSAEHGSTGHGEAGGHGGGGHGEGGHGAGSGHGAEGGHGGGEGGGEGEGGGHHKPIVISDKFLNDTLLQKYSYCLYWSVKMMTSKPYELANPTTTNEFLFHIFDAFLGIFMFASIVSEVDGIIERINKASDDFKEKLDSVKQYISMRKVGREMESRVVKWFDYVWANNGSLDEDSVLAVLPAYLRMEIARFVHLDVLKKVPIFQGIDEQFLLELAEKLRFEAFCPGDYVCRKGDIGREIYVVRRGLLNVIAADGVKVIVTLKSGVVFGELSLLNVPGSANGNRRTVTVRTVGYADLFSLSKEAFWTCLEEYPDVKEQLMEKARKILQKDNLYNEEAAREAARRGRNFEEVAGRLEENLDVMSRRLMRFWQEQIEINQSLLSKLERLETLRRQQRKNQTKVREVGDLLDLSQDITGATVAP